MGAKACSSRSNDRPTGPRLGLSATPSGVAAFDFTGKVVLVTGGTRGVGRGISDAFCDAGATVAVTARREPDFALVAPGGGEPSFHPADVRDFDQVEALVADVVKRHGRLDIVINNAGGSPPADTLTASPRFSSAIVALNLLAPLYVTQAAHPHLARAGGSVVNIGSVSATRPSPGTAAYGAAKAGLANLTRTLAVELAPHVRVNLLTGGLIDTEQSDLHYGDAASAGAAAATVPMGRLAVPADVANACLFLASGLAAHITGADLAVHGGGERPAFLDAVEAASGDRSA